MTTTTLTLGLSLNEVMSALRAGTTTSEAAIAYLTPRAENGKGSGLRAAKAIEQLRDGTFAGYTRTTPTVAAPVKAKAPKVAKVAKVAPVASPAPESTPVKFNRQNLTLRMGNVEASILALASQAAATNEALTIICAKLGVTA
jgi:hypothetical protein